VGEVGETNHALTTNEKQSNQHMLSSSGPGTTNLRDLNEVNNRQQKDADSEEEDYENDADFN